MNNFLTLFQSLKNYAIWGNSAYEYLIAFLIFSLTLLILKILQLAVISKLTKMTEKTENDLDDLFSKAMDEISVLFYFTTAFFISLQWIETSPFLFKVVKVIFVLVASREVINTIGRLVKLGSQKYLERTRKGKNDLDMQHANTMINMVRKSLVVILWLIVGTFVLSNFGINITSLVAGLGVGGVAVAFALQNILGNVFSSISIFLDEPFKVGDLIRVGENTGEVKRIGVKTTRIETLRGEELIIPNTTLTSSNIQNFSKLEEFREEITIGVSYETSWEQLNNISEMIKEITENIEDVSLERCNLSNYGDSSILFRIVFYVKTDDFGILDEKIEELSLQIFDKFNQEGIEMPFPTHNVYLKKQS